MLAPGYVPMYVDNYVVHQLENGLRSRDYTSSNLKLRTSTRSVVRLSSTISIRIKGPLSDSEIGALDFRFRVAILFLDETKWPTRGGGSAKSAT